MGPFPLAASSSSLSLSNSPSRFLYSLGADGGTKPWVGGAHWQGPWEPVGSCASTPEAGSPGFQRNRCGGEGQEGSLEAVGCR